MTTINVSDVCSLADEIKKDQGFERKLYPVTCNQASQLGHPCDKFLFYNRKSWQEKSLRDWKGIGERGNLLHTAWCNRMSSKGYRLIQGEMPLSQELRIKYQIGGRIDGRIGKNGSRPVLYEFKTMNENTWKKINVYEDIKDSPIDYIKMYVAQLQVYMFDNNEESGLYILCNASTLECKLIVVQLDYDYCEWLLQRAETINKSLVHDMNPFPRIAYGKTCERCEFSHICLPDIKNEGLEFVDNEALTEYLKIRAEHKEAHELYEEADESAKMIAKNQGKDFVCGDWKIEVNHITQKKVDLKAIPIDVKKLYTVSIEQIRTKFIPLG